MDPQSFYGLGGVPLVVALVQLAKDRWRVATLTAAMVCFLLAINK